MADDTTPAAMPTQVQPVIQLPVAHTAVQKPLADPIDAFLPSCQVALSFSNLTYSVPDKDAPGGKRVLLNNISGHVEPGEMLAIMGASGSGKTLLLECLAGVIKPGARVDGSILFNGHTREQAKSRLRRISAYVHASDALMATLTVTETLQYAADLQLPATITANQKTMLVNKLIDDLGLRICATTLVGGQFLRGISGGQKKRLAIGIEMISRPCLAFLDVPTSGLDSTAANVVMDGILQLAKQGRTVVTTIHQPSSSLFKKFDKLMLLAHGQVIYYGRASQAIGFFESLGRPCPALANPPDFFLQQINTDFKGATKEEVQYMAEEYKTSQQYGVLEKELAVVESERTATKEEMKQHVPPFARNGFAQFGILLRRNVDNAFRNPALYWVRVAMFVMLAVVLGTLYANLEDKEADVYRRLALLFFIVAFLSFMTVAALPELIVDRSIFTRERRNGSYRVSAYFMASTLASLPWIVIITLAVSVIVYWWTGLTDGRFGYFFGLLFGALFCAESIVVLVASLTNVFLLGLAAGSGVFGLFMLVSGFFLTFGDIPAYFQWISYLSFHMYAFRSLAYNELNDRTFKCDGSASFPSICNPRNPATFSGNTVLEAFKYNSDHRATDLVVLFAFIVGYRLLAYGALRFFSSGKKA